MNKTMDDFNETICETCGKNFNGPMKEKAQELALHQAEAHDIRPSDKKEENK